MLAESRIVSSLEKVFCSSTLGAERFEHISALKGERVSFQIAVRCDKPALLEAEIADSAGLAEYITIREVRNIPSQLPAIEQDSYTLRTEPGIFPDALMPFDGKIALSPGNWYALWVSVDVPGDAAAKNYGLTFQLKFFHRHAHLYWCTDPYSELEESITLEVVDAALPAEQKLKVTHWFYADCIMEHYRVGAWSEEHWVLLEKYFTNFARHRNNMLLTPLWSVPLDIRPGVTSRPCCQLLKITLDNGRWSFDFDRLERWISTAKKCGITNFEMVHTFSQWGLKYAPEIMVDTGGGERPLFGVEVPFDSPEYAGFLRALMRELLPLLEKNGLTPENCCFHISDEPGKNALDNYRKASMFMREIVGGYPVIDALSDVEFFRESLIRCPVINLPELPQFMDEDIKERWVYYAGAWENDLPGRMFGMPSLRNRVLGILLYVYGCAGFLNWGYNFWFGVYCGKWDIDPFAESNADRCFASGGAYLVYPGNSGAIDSLRHEVFAEGICDEMALRLLESRTSREEVLRWLDSETGYRITMNKYPHDEKWLLELRHKLNLRLASFDK